MDWDHSARTWDDDPAVRLYAAAAFESLRDVASALGLDLRGVRVLDFGCGTGLLTERLASIAADVIAVDRSPGMIEAVAAKIDRLGPARVQAICADITSPAAALPTPLTAAFDLVVCSSVCAFVDDYAETVSRLVQLLRPRGVFVQWDWELDPRDDEPFGLTRDGVRRALTRASLDRVHVGDGFTLELDGKVVTPLVGAGRRA